MTNDQGPYQLGAARPLLLRMRTDLVVQPQRYLGRQYWVVKDPLSQKYYRFEEEEFALLEMLDGHTSLQELQQQFERRFAPQKITFRELHRLISMLHRSCLVVSHAPGQGQELLKRRRQRVRSERWAAMTNVLCVRFKGIDPDRLLTWLNRRVSWFFSPLAFLACSTLALAALVLISVQFDVFQAKLPGFYDFFASENWIWLAATLAVTKILHEFGHGLACKRFGGECHEMGFMLLVLTPCLYCNVSDSWMLPSKWQRAAIGAAGMYVELVLASTCTFLWWFSEPGLIHHLCLNVMFVCSVSTLLFNANPLLRYDGYYILSDLIEIPNLRQKASTILHRKLGAWMLGLPEQPDPFLPQRRQALFALYSICAALYRWLIVFGILWFLYHVFEPYGLKLVGQIIAGIALYGLLVQPLWRLARFFYVPGRIDRVSKARTSLSVAALGAAVLAAFWVPWPHFVRCNLYVQPRGAEAAYVKAPGRLSEIHVQPGDWVRAGHPLVSLENVQIQLEIARLADQLRQLESKLEGLRRRAFAEEAAALSISEVEQEIAAVEQQLARREREAEDLQLAAPADGFVIPPPARPERSAEDGQLPHWSGSPLQQQNLQAFLDAGVLVCQVGDPSQLEAVLAIDQGDVEFVHPGQTVDILLEQLPAERFRSQLVQLSQLDMEVTPQGLSSKRGGGLVTRTDASGRERPASTTYQASAPLDDEQGLIFVGATGQARIHAGYQTAAQRAWRFLCQTFSFDV